MVKQNLNRVPHIGMEFAFSCAQHLDVLKRNKNAEVARMRFDETRGEWVLLPNTTKRGLMVFLYSMEPGSDVVAASVQRNADTIIIRRIAPTGTGVYAEAYEKYSGVEAPINPFEDLPVSQEQKGREGQGC